MKQLFKTLIALCMIVMIAFSAMIVVSAETAESEEGTVTVSIADDGGSRAYQLVWRYKESNGHIYKRRWNLTLNKWYDPAWILVQ